MTKGKKMGRRGELGAKKNVGEKKIKNGEKKREHQKTNTNRNYFLHLFTYCHTKYHSFYHYCPSLEIYNFFFELTLKFFLFRNRKHETTAYMSTATTPKRPVGRSGWNARYVYFFRLRTSCSGFSKISRFL